MLQLLKRIFAAALLPLFLIGTPLSAFADDPIVLPDGTVVPANSSSTPAANASSYVKPGEFSAGSKQAMDKITALFSSVMDTAVEISKQIKPEADKFAGGLGVITLILAAIRFAATRDPVMAWLAFFEEVAVLGIFASFYIEFAQFGPGFYKWFLSLANTIGGTDMSSTLGVIGSAAGQILDAIVKAFSGAGWTAIFSVAVAMVPLFLAWLVLSVTSVVFAFFINLGQLQFACGVVMGQIAFALGFSTFTRGYFKTWLDYMISAGMYVVVAAILMRLVTQSLIAAVQDATAKGLSTSGASGYVFDLAVFVFLISFEIPKIAGMFGGGANASGSIVAKVGRAATAGLMT
ncbi:hypothetical protein PTKU64_91580 (plasmid) [Paraburkholderia terrae]|uniref:TrbL/VirB6 plasmid conjugal transfer protein n=1 Tax=Paraburkholderia terrae TaxID=311230 RepID=A0ABM7U2H4_9BURK|nr:type IV secretion system protein [Paraburkholderia terrae]BCZ85483.1 hypothetical protein PTKU64_91580 [Paraburkholderia terrae]